MIPNTLPQGLLDNPRLDQWIGFEDCGFVRVATGKAAPGQGILSAVAQLAADAGLAVNPDGVANQIEGGIIQGASWALKENVTFEGERSTARTWDAYPILKFSEVPAIEIDVLQHADAPMLGMGEVSQGPSARPSPTPSPTRSVSASATCR